VKRKEGKIHYCTDFRVRGIGKRLERNSRYKYRNKR
jgi:hypothetical protein